MATSQTVERSLIEKSDGGRAGSGAGDVLAHAGRSRDDHARNGRAHDRLRIGAAPRRGGLQRADLGVAHALDAGAGAGGLERGLGGAQVALGGHQVGLGLLEVLQRRPLDLEQLLLAVGGGLGDLDLGAGGLHRGGGRAEVAFALGELGGRDGVERIALLHALPRDGEDLGDPAGVGGEDLGRALVVGGDLAVGVDGGREVGLPHLDELQVRPLARSRREHARRLGRRRRRVAGEQLAGEAGQQHDGHDRADRGREHPDLLALRHLHHPEV